MRIALVIFGTIAMASADDQKKPQKSQAPTDPILAQHVRDLLKPSDDPGSWCKTPELNNDLWKVLAPPPPVKPAKKPVTRL